jgi:hypothetical protein
MEADSAAVLGENVCQKRLNSLECFVTKCRKFAEKYLSRAREATQAKACGAIADSCSIACTYEQNTRFDNHGV